MHSNLDGADPSSIWCCKESLCPFFAHYQAARPYLCFTKRNFLSVYTGGLGKGGWRLLAAVQKADVKLRTSTFSGLNYLKYIFFRVQWIEFHACKR